MLLSFSIRDVDRLCLVRCPPVLDHQNASLRWITGWKNRYINRKVNIGRRAEVKSRAMISVVPAVLKQHNQPVGAEIAPAALLDIDASAHQEAALRC